MYWLPDKNPGMILRAWEKADRHGDGHIRAEASGAEKQVSFVTVRGKEFAFKWSRQYTLSTGVIDSDLFCEVSAQEFGYVNSDHILHYTAWAVIDGTFFALQPLCEVGMESHTAFSEFMSELNRENNIHDLHSTNVGTDRMGSPVVLDWGHSDGAREFAGFVHRAGGCWSMKEGDTMEDVHAEAA